MFCANRQLVPGTAGNVSTTLQQIQARNQQSIVGYSSPCRVISVHSFFH
jgi:hypothetical protein